MNDDSAEPLRSARLRIAGHIAHRLGFGPISTMPVGLARRLEQEVDDAVAAWRTARERDPLLAPRTELQRLLATYHDLSGGGPPGP